MIMIISHVTFYVLQMVGYIFLVKRGKNVGCYSLGINVFFNIYERIKDMSLSSHTLCVLGTEFSCHFGKSMQFELK